MPPRPRPPFEVIEPHLALEVFVEPFGAPSLLEGPHEALARRAVRQVREVEVRGRVLAVATVGRDAVSLAAEAAMESGDEASLESALRASG